MLRFAFLFITLVHILLLQSQPGCSRLEVPPRAENAEAGSAFMDRIAPLTLAEREEEIYKALATGNMPGFLRKLIKIDAEFADAEGVVRKVSYEVMPDYLSVGSDDDFCRIPMNPHTAQRIATLFGTSMITARLSDHIYEKAEVKPAPFNYVPVGNANELVSRFREHHEQIEKQLAEAGGKHGMLVAGIKKDVIISARMAARQDRVVIYGWHKPDGKPIQPVYSGHVDWYVDYSHGIRLVSNRVFIDGEPALLTEVLKDPVLFRLFSDEESPMTQTVYIKDR